MKVKVYNNFGDISFNYEKIIKTVKKYFREKMEISVILVNLEEIQRINLEYRNKDYATDVISFESGEDKYIGDIFISIEKAIEQANNYAHSVEREFAFLLVHGILHLQGYDHQTKEEETVMFQRQEDILNQMKYFREK